jgi:6-pyruvoyltetrahydropterin/6-carboxytetrahydropterin synthase
MKFELKTQFRIESARFLPHLPEDHPCRRLHGHGFVIILKLVGELDPKIGWVRDYHEIEKIARPLLSEIDHRVLNEVPGLENPTSEILCKWLFDRLTKHIPELKQVSVCETPTTECSYPVLP